MWCRARPAPGRLSEVAARSRIAPSPLPAGPPPPGPADLPSGPPASERGECRTWSERQLSGTPLLQATYLGHRFARHSHERFEIGVNESGAHRVWYRGGVHLVPPLSLVVICPGEVHDGRWVEPAAWRYRAIFPERSTIDGLAGDGLGRRRGCWLTFPQLVYPDPGLAVRFLRAHRQLAEVSPSAAAEGEMLECLRVLVARHARWRPQPAAAGERPGVARARELIDRRIGKATTLEEMARAAGLSRFHFLRAFRQDHGLTPHEYLVVRRVDRAQDILRGGTPLSAAAYALGFADQSHLTRQFKVLVGVTPGEFARGCARTFKTSRS